MNNRVEALKTFWRGFGPAAIVISVAYSLIVWFTTPKD